MKRVTAYLKAALAIVVLWVAVLFGGTALAYLINAFSFAGYEAGSLGWYAVGIVGGPLGVYLGKEAMEKITGQSAYIFRAVNYIVVAVFCSVVAIFTLIMQTWSLYYLLLEIAIAVAAGIVAAGEFKDMKKEMVENGHNS